MGQPSVIQRNVMPHKAVYLDKLDEVWDERQRRYKMTTQPFVLRDYQNQAIQEITGSLALGSNKVILDAPTGAGKSAILSGLAKDLPGKVAIVVTFTPLIEQIAEHLDMMNIEYSILKAGMDDRFDPEKRVQLIMKQTLYARKDKLNLKVDYMLKDEVHVEWFGQKRMDEIYKSLGEPMLVGVSGTPWDSRGYKLKGSDDLIRTKSIKQLTEEGHLSPLKYYIPKWAENIDYSQISIKGKDYSESDIDGIVMTDDYMDQAIDSMLQMDIVNKKSVVFCNSIKHAESVAAILKAKGVKAYPFHSNMDKNKSELILESFKSNKPVSQNDGLIGIHDDIECTCLVAVNKISIGFDSKDIMLGVLMRKTAVRSLYYQQVGRLIRTHPTKTHGEILDLAGLVGDFGFHDEVYNPPEYGNKNKLAKITEELAAREVKLIVNEEPTEVTRSDVKVKVEELNRKKKQMHELNFTDLLAIFESSWDPKEIVEAAMNINHRKTGQTFKYSTINWVAEPWYTFIEEYPQYRNRILKSMKTRAKNIVAQGKKLASLHYFPSFLREQSPYVDYTLPDSVDVSEEVYNAYANIDDIFNDEIPF